ncbi:MAG: 16S rRNA (adenine(1518)-N(6)/adenine(1519)-N(6))-dimethyltransferase RsmA [Planctomycetota bacterium]|jgi:16S rRNA (adenine1518-N6/adenine1519-N6)-dimethyltransferase
MTEEHVQTKREIEGLLRAAGVRPRKRFGQHFLIDGNLMRRLVACAELDPDDLVLEVGAGTGGLTDLLVTRAQHVVVVEVDRALLAILEERFAGVDGVTLIPGDVLERKHAIRREVIEVISGFDGAAGGSVKLVANLPYQVATPLVLNLLVDHPQVRRLCFTVQAEVGERITAKSGSKAFGPISILAQTLCHVDTVRRVPPAAFWPRPAVDSVMLRLEVKTSPSLDHKASKAFAEFVRGIFDHRRKTLRAALGYVVSEDVREHLCQHFDATRRPESFSVEEWLEIFQTYNCRK